MSSGIMLWFLCSLIGCAFANNIPAPNDFARPNYDNIPRCIQPPESGLCLAYIHSYYYNPSTRKCETFVFGGCHGNENRFATEQECLQACEGYEPSTVDFQLITEATETKQQAATEICSLPKQPGLCYAYFEKYYFNGEKCEKFVYGGCMGNANNFETEEACERACPRRSSETIASQTQER